MANLSTYMLLLSSVAAQAWIGKSPKESFHEMSLADEEWADSSKVGAILGFVVFGIALLGTVAAIFYDTHKRSQEYDEKIADAMQTMTNLGMQKDMEQIKKELQVRLSGAVLEDGVDDQLLGEAQKLQLADYKQYM